jgi:simple sugar transport system ATP-binding protein
VINQLTVYQNMFLNREKVRWPLLNSRAMRREAKERLDEIGVQIPDINAAVAQLSGGQRQAIAVARSVFSNPKILLLDEPLAAMGVKEGSLILDLILKLKEQGNVSIIIIAHNYGQVLEVSDRVNMIQGGKITLDKRSEETSAEELTEMVVDEYRKALQERQRQAG